MQWLKDIVVALIGPIQIYTDRGDPPGADFTIGDFVIDGNWHTLDLSAIIPVGTIAVYVRTTMTGTQSNKNFLLREPGNTTAANVFLATTQLPNVFSPQLGRVNVNSNRQIEYMFSSIFITQMFMVINGWWTES